MATPSRAPESPTFYGPAAGEAYRRPFRTQSFPGRRLFKAWYGFPYMKTTLNIDDSVMQRLREEAARRGTTMSALVEAGLRRVLSDRVPGENQPEELPRLPSWHGGKELVDIANREELYGVMEEH